MPEEIKEETIQEEIKEETTPETTETTEETQEETTVDRRTAQALELLEALEDPKRNSQVVSHLANQLGLLKPETKAQEKEVVKTAKAIVKKHLGEDYTFISEKLGDALEEVLEEKTSSIRRELEEREQIRSQREFEDTYSTFLRENKVTEEEAGVMLQYAEEITPGKNVPLKNYLGKILKLTRVDLAEKAAQKQKQQKVVTNLKRRPETVGTEANDLRMAPKPKGEISVRDAVLAATRGEKWSDD